MWEKLILQNNINNTSSHFYIMHSQREQSIIVFLFLQTKTENNQTNKQSNKPSENGHYYTSKNRNNSNKQPKVNL